MRLAELAGVGGVVPKTLGLMVDWAAHPRNGRRIWYYKIGKQIMGTMDLELFTTKTREDWINGELAVAKEGGATMHISILAMPNPEDTARL